jgi:hypothetical protein
MAAEFKMEAKSGFSSKIFNFFFSLLTDTRKFKELKINRKFKMVDLFKMTEIYKTTPVIQFATILNSAAILKCLAKATYF